MNIKWIMVSTPDENGDTEIKLSGGFGNEVSFRVSGFNAVLVATSIVEGMQPYEDEDYENDDEPTIN